MKRKLETVTLLGIDCVDLEQLILAANICQKGFDFAEIKILTSLKSTDSRVVPIEPITSTEGYSKFVIEELKKYVTTEHVLIIQYDGFILNPDAWTDEFLKYDYIGAPWLVRDLFVSEFDFPKDLMGKMVVGNGGFCLRSKRFLNISAELAKEAELKRFHPEDVSLCVWNRGLLEEKGMRFAPVEIAKRFSCEDMTDEKDKWNGEFGFHGFRWTDISEWSKKHPEYQIDTELNRIRLFPTSSGLI